MKTQRTLFYKVEGLTDSANQSDVICSSAVQGPDGRRGSMGEKVGDQHHDCWFTRCLNTRAPCLNVCVRGCAGCNRQAWRSRIHGRSRCFRSTGRSQEVKELQMENKLWMFLSTRPCLCLQGPRGVRGQPGPRGIPGLPGPQVSASPAA